MTLPNAGLDEGKLLLHPVTLHNLQQLRGCIAISATSESSVQLMHRCTELPLEQWFGFLRTQYTSSQITVRDYLHAASKKMYQFSQRLSKDGSSQVPLQSGRPFMPAVPERPWTVHCSQCCADETVPALLKKYVAFSSGQLQAFSADEPRSTMPRTEGMEDFVEDEDPVPRARWRSAIQIFVAVTPSVFSSSTRYGRERQLML